MTDDTPRVDRRRLLAAVAAAGTGGLAGCPSVTINVGDDGGDGDGGDGGDVFGGTSDGSDGGDGTSGDLSCTDVTNGYEQQDVGERPILFDFEYPSMFDELVYAQMGPLALYEAEQSIGDDRSISMVINQATDPEESAQDVDEGGASGTTITFNGEEVEFAGVSSGSDLLWVGNLPYQFEGQRETFAMWIDFTVDGGSNECGDALRDAAEHILDSMAVNPDSTLGT